MSLFSLVLYFALVTKKNTFMTQYIVLTVCHMLDTDLNLQF